MKKTTKTSPTQVGFSFEASSPSPRQDRGTEVVSLRQYRASQEQARQAMIDRAIMDRAAHITSSRRPD